MRHRVATLLLFAYLAVASTPAAAIPPLFGPRTDLATSSSPRALAIGDLNEDGHADIAVACDGDSTICWFLGLGGGAFAPREDLVVGPHPTSIAIVDWDRDGHLDLLVGVGDTNPRVEVLHGDGAGDFFPGPATPVPGRCVKLVTANLDGDGRPDAAGVSDVSPSSGFVMHGLPGGGIGPAQIVSTDTGTSVVAAQLDSGPLVDLFLPRGCASCASVVLADGYAGGANNIFAPSAIDAVVFDHDMDGRNDLLVTGKSLLSSADVVLVYRNTGSGFSFERSIGIPGLLTSITAADFDGNGATDAVVTQYSPPGFSLILFDCPSGLSEIQSFQTGAGPVAIAAGDLDGDGHPDVVTANSAAGTISVRFGVVNVARVCFSAVASVTPALDFGASFQTHSTTVDAQLGSAGPAPLNVTGFSVDSPEFTVLTPLPMQPIAAGQSAAITVRYGRIALGNAAGTLTIATDDPAHPTVQVALSGSAGVPGTIAFAPDELPAPTLASGDTTTRVVVVRNVGEYPLSGIATIGSVGPGSPAAARARGAVTDATTPLPVDVLDATGRLWDIQPNGSIWTGSDSTFFGGFARIGFVPQAQATYEDGNRTLVFGPAAGPNGLVLQREVFVSPSAGFARFIEIVANPGPTTLAYKIDVLTNFRGSLGEPLATSSGDHALTTADDWVVLGDGDDTGGRQAVAQVVAATRRPNGATMATAGTFTRFTWNLTLGPGAMAAVAHFAVQANTVAEAAALAGQLAMLEGGALEGLDATERQLLLGTQPDEVFHVTPAAFALAPGDSATLTVRYRAAIFLGLPADISGLLTLATDNPFHPSDAIPLALHVVAQPDTGGSVLGVDPAGPARLALAGFVPNPLGAKTGGSVSYSLASDAPATIELFDVRGRRVWSQPVDAPRPGPAALRVERGVLGAAGMVWIRVTQAGRAVTARGVILP